MMASLYAHGFSLLILICSGVVSTWLPLGGRGCSTTASCETSRKVSAINSVDSTSSLVFSTRGGSSIGSSDDDDTVDDGDQDEDDGDNDYDELDDNGSVRGKPATSGSSSGRMKESANPGDDGQAAKVQFMVTGRMRQVLTEELNYLPGEVDMIEPQIAAVVIERGLARPSAGMPASWRKTNVAKAVTKRPRGRGGIPIISGLGNLFGAVVESVGSLLGNASATIPLLAGAVFLLAQSGSIDPLLDSLQGFNIKMPKIRKTSSAPKMKSPSPPRKKVSKKTVGINVHSMESMHGKGYNTWLDKMR